MLVFGLVSISFIVVSSPSPFRNVLNCLCKANVRTTLALKRKDIREVLVSWPVFVVTDCLTDHLIGLVLAFTLIVHSL